MPNRAIEILRQMKDGGFPGEHVFPGQRPKKPLSNMALLALLKRMKRPDLTAHGFRSTFRDWAAVRGYRSADNPARWKGHLDKLLPPRSKVQRVRHHAALPYEEMGAFMTDLRKREEGAARALEFTILTAARTSEVLNARWDEFDLNAKVWSIPGERMKAGKDHRVPLPEAGMAVLTKMAEVRQSPEQYWLPRSE